MAGATEVRHAALCLIRRGDSILVAEIRDAQNGTILHRPPGGGVEPNESPEEAVRREIREELGIVLADVKPLGAIEHTWFWGGREVRERAWIFLANASDYAALNAGETPSLTEADGETFRTLWRGIHESGETRPNLCPAALADLLKTSIRG